MSWENNSQKRFKNSIHNIYKKLKTSEKYKVWNKENLGFS